MSVSPLSATARRAIDAYGGADRWKRARQAQAQVTMSGLLFHLKWRHLPAGSRITVDLDKPASRLEPIDRAGRIGVLDGRDVRLEDGKGAVLDRRPEARRLFPNGGHRALYWDALDLTYFLGYAFWGYFSLPALLQRDDIAWTEIKDGLLEARFPAHLPRHSEIQRFYFDGKGLLTRNDYVAEVFGSWAQAANVVQEHKEWEGIPYPSRRRVTRREKDGSYRPFPTMIGMEIADWRLLD